MMKTTISICCDNCEKVLSDDTICYGIKRNSPSNDLFICESCMKKLLSNSLDRYSLFDFLQYSPCRVQDYLSLSIIINHNSFKIGELRYTHHLSICKEYEINTFVYSYNDYRSTIILDEDFFETIGANREVRINCKEAIVEMILNGIDHDKLSSLRSRYNAERNYSASISTSQYIEH